MGGGGVRLEGGGGGLSNWTGQGCCERKIEVFEKIQKKNRGGGCSGWGRCSGGGCGCERRIEVFVKIKIKNLGWGSGGGRVKLGVGGSGVRDGGRGSGWM